MEVLGNKIRIILNFAAQKVEDRSFQAAKAEIQPGNLRLREIEAGRSLAGKAIDVRLPGTDLKKLHTAALALQSGGVGYYPSSDFIHVDVGPVRHW